MERYDDDTYGESISEIYDSRYSDFDRRMIDCLFDFANDGKVLELGIGTGRVAIPLKERGIQIHGIDTSRSMVSKLKKKTNEDIPVIIQSFAEFKFDDQYDLIFVVFNSFFGLLTQNEQVSCLKSVANALLPGGRFVIEAFVPDLGRFDRGQSTRTTNLSSIEFRKNNGTFSSFVL